jgi:hypothetical protein
VTSPSSFWRPKMKSKVAPNNPSPNFDIRFDPLDPDQVRLLLQATSGRWAAHKRVNHLILRLHSRGRLPKLNRRKIP